MGEVKLAYFAKVKAVHPDTREDASENDNHEEFLELVEAYETLSCTRKRRLYDLQGASRGENDQRATATAQDTRDPQSSPYEPWKPGWESKDLAYFRRGLSLYESIREEFHEALAMARLGPQVPDFESEGLETMFPWAFEAEVRSDASHAHVLQLVSGRQALGYVETSTDPLLHLAPTGALDTKKESFAQTDADLDLVYQGRHVARAHRRGDQLIIFGTEMHLAKQEEEGGTFGSGGEEMRHLATISPSGSSEAAERSFLRSLGLPKLPPLSTRVPDPKPLENPFAPRLRPRSFDVLDDRLRSTHRIMQWSAMGVDTVYWFRGEKQRSTMVGKFNVANCAIKVTRASLPSPKFWLFEPRSEAHTSGAWYFEIARPELTEDQIAVAAQNYLQRAAQAESASEGGKVAPHLTPEVKMSWAIEKAAAQVRHERGVVDPRVAILFAAFSTIDS
ncbi:DnaJ-like 1, mitochondrial [Hondaea fermentalgiana]|uniref:DnaJ-like 1, mitochondrial n=1 Tax=Hondaea fermentalgiana TaxID=2315210 RepID=A0A2R5GS03_9STRA|nr:DnaJ-like 1, mitochondrial [Hondaea fermentalgiana]|eukprot:GBG32538.1 DnaJ-like 1, mitochondrial [Hondaea fermentalgiana]